LQNKHVSEIVGAHKGRRTRFDIGTRLQYIDIRNLTLKKLKIKKLKSSIT